MRVMLFFIASFFTTQALACSCQYFGLLEKWQRSEHVFIADVVKIKEITASNPEQYEQGQEQGVLSEAKLFKGQASAVPYLTAAQQPICCTCATKLAKQSYVVFAKQQGPLALSSCSMSMPLSDDSYYPEVLHYLQQKMPTTRFSGIYNAQQQTISLEYALEVKPLIEFDYRLTQVKSYLVFEGYELNDGSIFFVKAQQVTPLE